MSEVTRPGYIDSDAELCGTSSCHLSERVCPKTTREAAGYYNQNPLLPAEQLCLNGLMAHNISRPKDELKGLCAETEFLLDYALALPTEASTDKELLFQNVVEKLSVINHEEDMFSRGRASYHATMQRLGVFMPAFRERIFSGDVSHDTKKATHASLITWLDNFDTAYIKGRPIDNYRIKKQIESVKQEAEIMGLLTRTNYQFPYPALGREEASHARASHNHDFYTLSRDKSHKIPVQVKASKKASGYTGVVMIRHYDITRAINETINKDSVGTSKKLPSITDMLVAELQSGQHNQATETWLNLASMYVISRMDSFDDFRND